MSAPETQNWSQLVQRVSNAEVAPAQQLRPGHPAVLQYVEGGSELLAVQSVKPYGLRTVNDPTATKPANLLEVYSQGTDHTVYLIPEEMLSLQALVQGTGHSNAELLYPLFRGIGELIGHYALDKSVRSPLIRMRDLAIDRKGMETVFLPPLVFGRRIRGLLEYSHAFLSSVDSNLGDSWPPMASESLRIGFIEGFNHVIPETHS